MIDRPMMLGMLSVTLAFCSCASTPDRAGDNSKEWTTAGPTLPDFATLDVRQAFPTSHEQGAAMRKVTLRERVPGAEEGSHSYPVVELGLLLEKTGKTLAVLQVIDVSLTGHVCGGCLGKGKKIFEGIQGSDTLNPDVAYIMVISPKDQSTPTERFMDTVRARVPEEMKVVADIDGHFQRSFNRLAKEGRQEALQEGPGQPVTVLVDSKFRGRVIDRMEQNQASGVLSAANALYMNVRSEQDEDEQG
ncbi:MAG: hypothetical protein CMJ33_06295 [Phycisphaerae bacterium]|nr:hypothetical protein [Phycisphaerae bacterium]HAW94923.1 hypothetical protein [Phycisphaerales bacterium]